MATKFAQTKAAMRNIAVGVRRSPSRKSPSGMRADSAPAFSDAPRFGSIRNLANTRPRMTPQPPKMTNDDRHPKCSAMSAEK